MKKLLTLIIISLFTINGYSQVFNTAKTLKPGKFSIGLEPAFLIDGDDFMMFFHGGLGVKKGIDIAVKIGAGGETYFGGDIEWALLKNISLTTGIHHFYEIGLDASINANIPVKSDVDIYTGLDTDIIFADDLIVPLWIPVGVDIGMSKSIDILLEGEICLTDNAYHLIGGGVAFFF